jgi:uncharacterized protein
METYSPTSYEEYGKNIIFGYFDIPFKIEQKDLLINVEKEGKNIHYYRKCRRETIEKLLLLNSGQFLFNPVEPVNKPKEITPFFLVKLDQTLVLKPKEKREIAVTFPIEIASIFIADDKSETVLDIFSLVDQKYTLYGNSKSGIICRYWNSSAYSLPPSPDPLLEGIIRINMRNTTSKWVEVTRIVFSAHEMKIFYNHNLVSLKAYMKILSETTAETGFNNSPPEKDMKKSTELLTSKKFTMSGSKLLMEEGI